MTVRGDPELDLTDEHYRAREAFLVELLTLRRVVRERAGVAPRASCRGVSGDLGEACGIVSRLYGAINGQGIRPGSMYGPTAQDRMQVARAVELMGR